MARMGRPPKPASRKQRAKAKRLKMGLRLIDVADYLGISFQSLTSKETGEQPWKWCEVQRFIFLYEIKTTEELLKLFGDKKIRFQVENDLKKLKRRVKK